MDKQYQKGWWRRIDYLGLLGCAALMGGTYVMFWYYIEVVSGRL